MHGDVAELFLAETNSMMPGEACNYLQVNDMDSSSEFRLEDEDNLRIILDEFELLDFANSTLLNNLSKIRMLARTFSVKSSLHCIVRNKRIAII